jgi:hypothetical protein
MTAAASGKRTMARRLPSRWVSGCIAITAGVIAAPLLSVAADERPTPTELSRAVSLALDPDRASSRDSRIQIEVPETSVQQGSRTVMTFDNVQFDRELEDSMFEPSRLGSALERIQATERSAAAPAGGAAP